MAGKIFCHVTAANVFQEYGLTLHGPLPQSSVTGSPEFEKSQELEEVQLEYPAALEFSEMKVQEVMKVWVAMNLANQDFVRASARFYPTVGSNEKPICQLLTDRQSDALKFQEAFNRMQETVKEWQLYADAGYEVTIIK